MTYSTYLGGSVEEFGQAIAVDSVGNAYVAGYTSSADFPVASSLQAYAGLNDAFVSVLEPGSAALAYSTFVGAAGDDFATGVAVNAAGDVYLSGQSTSSSFPRSANALQPLLFGDSDAFVTKIGKSGGSPPPAAVPATRPATLVALALSLGIAGVTSLGVGKRRRRWRRGA